MGYKALIIEDESAASDHLASLLHVHFSFIEIAAILRSFDEAKHYLDQHSIDLVFLDVHLPGNTGFELLQACKNQQFQVIFVTGYDRYAIQALRCQALDYLLKPVDIDALQEAIERFKMKVDSDGNNAPGWNITSSSKIDQDSAPTFLTLYDHEGFHLVPFSDIIYLKGENNYTHFHLADGSHKLTSKTLKEYESLLEPLGFIRIHKSSVINPVWIKSYLYELTGQVEMKNGTRLDVSRRRSQLLFEAIDRFSIGTKAKTKFRV